MVYILSFWHRGELGAWYYVCSSKRQALDAAKNDFCHGLKEVNIDRHYELDTGEWAITKEDYFYTGA